MLNTRVSKVAFDELAQRLSKLGEVSYNEFMLHFTVDDHDIFVFPDGRAIIKNTIDEAKARELYARYVGEPG